MDELRLVLTSDCTLKTAGKICRTDIGVTINPIFVICLETESPAVNLTLTSPTGKQYIKPQNSTQLRIITDEYYGRWDYMWDYLAPSGWGTGGGGFFNVYGSPGGFYYEYIKVDKTIYSLASGLELGYSLNTGTITEYGILATKPETTLGVTITLNRAIDVSVYNKIVVETAPQFTDKPSGFQFGIIANNNPNYSGQAGTLNKEYVRGLYVREENFEAGATYEVDISDIVGNYYFKLSAINTTTCYITNLTFKV